MNPLTILAELSDNPIIRRGFRITRPQWLITRAGALSVVGVLASLALGVLLSFLPTRLYLDELALWVGMPAFLLYGMYQYFAINRFYTSTLPTELRLTGITAHEVIAGLYITRLLPVVWPLLIAVSLLPWMAEAFVRPSVTAYLAFLIWFVALFEWTARIIFMVGVQTGGVEFAGATFALSFAGFSMIYAAGGLLKRIPDGIVETPLTIGLAVAGSILFGSSVWRPWLNLTAKSHIRRARILEEKDPAEVDRPEPKRYLKR